MLYPTYQIQYLLRVFLHDIDRAPPTQPLYFLVHPAI